MRSRRLAIQLLAATLLAAGALPASALASRDAPASAAQAGGAPVESPASAAGGGAAPGRPAARQPGGGPSRPAGGARFGVKPPPDPRIRRRALARKRALAKRRAAARTRLLAQRRAARRRALARRRAPARRHAAQPAPAPPSFAGRFPVAGAYRILGGDGRFGAQRPGHIHQGQDIAAAEGTPVVAPVAGTIAYRSYQRGGAGYYVVLHANSGRDYVFMHLRKGSIEVLPGDPVGAGRQLAEVGQTGHATGPHLHFEVWIGGWGSKRGEPIDPLPSLRAWAR